MLNILEQILFLPGAFLVFLSGAFLAPGRILLLARGRVLNSSVCDGVTLGGMVTKKNGRPCPSAFGTISY
jgi:hypothetical protein